jgi:hypothetical protein
LDFCTGHRNNLAFCSRSNPVFELEGEIVDLATGVLRVTLPSDLVEIAGVYEGSWALVNASDEIVYIGNSLLSVERSLFPASLTTLYRYKGPPTIQEIRLAIRDSGGPESLLLEDVQFGGEEILNAIVRTVSLWNELLPPVRSAVYTTRTFPFKEQWLRGIVAYLFLAAADYYRANRLHLRRSVRRPRRQGSGRYFLRFGRSRCRRRSQRRRRCQHRVRSLQRLGQQLGRVRYCGRAGSGSGSDHRQQLGGFGYRGRCRTGGYADHRQLCCRARRVHFVRYNRSCGRRRFGQDCGS